MTMMSAGLPPSKVKSMECPFGDVQSDLRIWKLLFARRDGHFPIVWVIGDVEIIAPCRAFWQWLNILSRLRQHVLVNDSALIRYCPAIAGHWVLILDSLKRFIM